MSQKYDFTHITSVDPNDLTLVDSLLLEFANWIRTKAYGKDVRESISRLGERLGIILNQYQAETHRTSNEMALLKNELEETIHGLTQDSEVKNARVDIEGVVYETLKKRLDDMQLKTGELGHNVGTEELSGDSLYIEGLDQADSPFSYEVISTEEETDIPFGVKTIKATDIGFEPAGDDK